MEGSAVGRHDRSRVTAARGRQPEDDVDVGLGEQVRDQARLARGSEDRRDIRVHGVVGQDHRPAAGVARVEGVDVLRHELGPDLEVGQLLGPELVVEAVEDEDRDQQEGQADDAGEPERQATLERLRAHPPDRLRDQPRPPQPDPPAAARGARPIGLRGRAIGLGLIPDRARRGVRGRARSSARRRRSRRPGPSSRRPGRRDRPRSCPADG